jgi:hypothetical protein
MTTIAIFVVNYNEFNGLVTSSPDPIPEVHDLIVFNASDDPSSAHSPYIPLRLLLS